MADQGQSNRGSSGADANASTGAEPFAVTQARRELKEAQQRFNEAKKNKVPLKEFKDAVDRAQTWVDRLTKGNSADRREATTTYMKRYFDKLPDWAEQMYRQFPDLRDFIERAMANNWNEKTFLDNFKNTDFYKNPSRLSSWFTAFQMEYGSPKQFQQTLVNLKDPILAAAKKYGVTLTDDQIQSISRRYLYEGWAANPNQLDSYIARIFKKQSGQYESTDYVLGGTVAANATMLRNLARDMGLTFDDKWFTANAAKLTETRQNYTLRDVQQLMLDETLKQFGLTSEDLGFIGSDATSFLSLKDAVASAIDAGGDTARRLLENSSIQNLLTNWKGRGGYSLAEYWKQQQDVARTEILSQARALGLNLDEATISQLSREYYYSNWDDNPMGLKKYLAELSANGNGSGEGGTGGGGGDTGGGGGGDTGGGGGGDTGGGGGEGGGGGGNTNDPVYDTGNQAGLERQLRSWAQNYGVQLGNEWFQSWVNKIVLTPDSGYTKDDALNEIIKLARQIYPAFSDEINDGKTVRDVAAGYISSMANLLELDTTAVDLTDPLLQRALTGRNSEGKPAIPSMYDFAAMVRKDDRWQSTDNALSAYSRTANDILRKMGFVG